MEQELLCWELLDLILQVLLVLTLQAPLYVAEHPGLPVAGVARPAASTVAGSGAAPIVTVGTSVASVAGPAEDAGGAGGAGEHEEQEQGG